MTFCHFGKSGEASQRHFVISETPARLSCNISSFRKLRRGISRHFVLPEILERHFTPYLIKFRSPSLTLVGALKAIAIGSKVADLIMLGASLDYVIPCIDR
jgi:NADH:ubiquinone oxidoreductase subunit D